jgi:GntR family transcriptional regulator/MocR family aminotransferase
LQILLSGVVDLNRQVTAHLYVQLYRALREAILSGTLKPGDRIPPSRAAAADLDVSRRTVLAAFEQLSGEGFLESRQGSGIRVANWRRQIEASDKASVPRTGSATIRPAGRWAALWREARPDDASAPPRALRPGLPDLRLFPKEIWGRLLRRASARLAAHDRGYTFQSGHPALKQALVRHLAERRLVDVEADQVVVTSSAQAALDLCARLMLEPGDRVWMEEPGYRGARAAFRFAGAKLIPVPVDEDGLNFEPFADGPPPKIIYVSPSHQYPMGCTLSLKRRHALLDYAASVGAAIIEDDYDSEFQFEGRPIAAMQGLRPDAPVIYLGTFSKTIAPALRLAYIAAPDSLTDSLIRLQNNTGQCCASDIQFAAAEFLSEGHYATHLRRSQRLYGQRRDRLIGALEVQLGDLFAVSRPAGGVQLAAQVKTGASDMEIFNRLRDAGVETRALSDLCYGPPVRNGLLLGFAAWSEDEIGQAVDRMAACLKTL